MSPAACEAAFSDDVSRVATADIIFLACKRTANPEVVPAIAAHARPGTLIVTLQNGVGVGDEVRSLLGPRAAATCPIIECTVNFNVVRELPAERSIGSSSPRPVVFHWTSPRLASQPGFTLAPDESSAALVAPLEELLNGAGLYAASVSGRRAAAELQYAKLLVNIGFNAVNALSGVSTRETLAEPGWRYLTRCAIDEARAVLDRRGIRYAAHMIEKQRRLLGLPDPLARLVTRLALSRRAASSMWADVAANRPTEVRLLNGHVCALAAEVGAAAPLNGRLVELVEQATARQRGLPGLAARDMARGLVELERGIDAAEAAARRAWLLLGALGVSALALLVSWLAQRVFA